MLEQKDRVPVGSILLAVSLSALVATGGYFYAQRPQDIVTEDKGAVADVTVNDSTSNGASDFLREKAQERRDFIDQKWGPDAYGGSNQKGVAERYAERMNQNDTKQQPSTSEILRSLVKAAEDAKHMQPVLFSNGEVVNKPVSARRCPFSVEVKGEDAYYICMKSLVNSANTMAFMVKPGSFVELDVPSGTYEIYYATGKSWYGVDHKFGLETAYYKCDGTFYFAETSGWALELYKQANGNMDTDKISASDFPQ